MPLLFMVVDSGGRTLWHAWTSANYLFFVFWQLHCIFESPLWYALCQ